MKEFTNDEKIIARNINQKYKWIARDKCGALHAYTLRPVKKKDVKRWGNISCISCEIVRVNVLFGRELFKTIRWEDNEPTRISDIYNPQVLDDVERKYLKTVLRPFRKRVVYVEKCGCFPAREQIYSEEYLYIELDGEGISLPYFYAGKMYSGMERWKQYTLKELGITYKEVG